MNSNLYMDSIQDIFLRQKFEKNIFTQKTRNFEREIPRLNVHKCKPSYRKSRKTRNFEHTKNALKISPDIFGSKTKDMLLSNVSLTLIVSGTSVSTEIEFSQHKSKMHSLNCLRIKFNSLHGIAKRTIDTPQHCE